MSKLLDFVMIAILLVVGFLIAHLLVGFLVGLMFLL